MDPDHLGALPGVSCDVDDAYMDFIGRVFGHTTHGGASFQYFCEAQMVWDTTMAHRLVRYLEKELGQPW